MKIGWLNKLKESKKPPPAPEPRKYDVHNLKIENLKDLYKEGKHKELARVLPHARNLKDKFVDLLFESRLLTMGADLKELEPITFGADPEFILKDKNTHQIVLFSSEYVREHEGINLSEASLGADYGLLEIRPPAGTTPKILVDNVEMILSVFDKRYTQIELSEIEATVFDHKKERIRSLIRNEETDFGVALHKIQMGTIQNINMSDETSYINMTLSAYDEPLIFQPRDDLLTAGGHIHIGGTFIRMLSLEQLKYLIRTIDKSVYNLAARVETEAANLRREVYGNRGEFRIKPYGVEYRTLSNAIFWPKNAVTLKTILDDMHTIAKNILLKP